MIFHLHKWVVLEVGRYQRHSIFSRSTEGSPITITLYVCEKCGNHKTNEVTGWWEALHDGVR